MTLIQVGLENKVEGRTLAWALDYPGVFAYGSDDAEALMRLPHEMLRFENWLNLRTDQPWVQLEGLDMHIDDTFEVFPVWHNAEAYEVNAFFRSDLTPLREEEVHKAILIYNWQREELLAGVETLAGEFLKREFEGQRWTIEGILEHIARVENWYFSRLGFDYPLPVESGNPLPLLELSAEATNRILPELINLNQIFERHQEKWSARKLVRRLLWHQRDHIDHIRELVFRYTEVNPQL